VFTDSIINIGVLGGMAISVFSKPLALLIGLLIVGVQVCILLLLTIQTHSTFSHPSRNY
jgi:ABC-type antimicrobial peptide transport system permease subunit